MLITRLLISSFFFILTFSAFGQTYQRQNSEKAETFIKRITKLDELPHPVIETKEWDSVKKVIIYFVANTKNDDEESIIGYMLVPTKDLLYQRILIDTFHEEGGPTKIESVFFANADKDKEREIVVQTSWLQIHKGAGVYGTLYGTYIYDTPNLLRPQDRLIFYKKLSEKLDGGFEGDEGGKSVKAKYKTVSSIRLALKQMAY